MFDEIYKKQQTDTFLTLGGLKLIVVGHRHQKYFHASIMPSAPQISTIIFD